MKLEQSKHEKIDTKELGSKIKVTRKKAHLTQSEVANQLGKSLRTIQKYESGEIEPPYNVLQQMISLFHCEPEDILLSAADETAYRHALNYFKSLEFPEDTIKETYTIEVDGEETTIEVESSIYLEVLGELQDKEEDINGPYHLAFDKFLNQLAEEYDPEFFGKKK